MTDWRDQKRLADRFLPLATEILRWRCLPHVLPIVVSSSFEDTREGTDLVLDVGNVGSIGWRVRNDRRDKTGKLRPEWREFTIHSRTTTGSRHTELAKLLAGDSPRWYLVLYVDDLRCGHAVQSWAFVDTTRAILSCRANTRALARRERQNRSDESWFTYLTYTELRDHGALIAQDQIP